MKPSSNTHSLNASTVRQSLRAAACAASLLIASLLQGQDFSIDWFAAAAGGGTSSGGDFEISATLGQPDAGSDIIGGDFSITGGFWSIVTLVETSSPPALSVSLDQGSLMIAWPMNGSAGFSLEEAPTLALANSWATVNLTPQTNGGTNTVRLPFATGNRFYRLHKP